MTLTPSQKDHISRVAKYCRTILDMYGPLTQLDVMWSGTPNYDELITQEGTDQVPVFLGAGLTMQYLADAEYFLATLKDGITNAIVALTVLGNIP